MSNVYTIDDSDLSIRDVIELRKAGVAGDLESIMHILNRIVITPDGKTCEQLNHRHLTAIIQKVLEITNGADVPNS